MAGQEAAALANCVDLDKDGKEKEHKRYHRFRDHVNAAVILIFWIICTSLAIGIAVFSWHMVMPVSLHYLTQGQLDKLQTVLISGLFSSALTGYVKQRMD